VLSPGVAMVTDIMATDMGGTVICGTADCDRPIHPSRRRFRNRVIPTMWNLIGRSGASAAAADAESGSLELFYRFRGFMVRDGARAPPHHEEIGSDPHPEGARSAVSKDASIGGPSKPGRYAGINLHLRRGAVEPEVEAEIEEGVLVEPEVHAEIERVDR
jgi:hypothetical protein